MLIYRVESCVSLFDSSLNIKLQAGIGPYTMNWLSGELLDKIRAMIGKLDLNVSDAWKLKAEKTEEFSNYLLSNDLKGFYHFDSNREQHPSPRSDAKLMKSLLESNQRFDTSLQFGFKSIEQLKNWFNENNRKTLRTHGFYVAIYETNRYYIGDKQCIFVKKDSTLVDFIDLGDLL